MKIAVVGKGGVGKTTIAAGLARLLGRDGYNVIAVDADPSLNLAIAVGIPLEVARKAPALFDEEEFIRSRTTLSGGLYIANPRVEDVVERFGIRGPDNVVVVKFGEVRRGGSRCLCPEYAFLRTLLSHLILGRRDVVILDMVAGLEPMSRGAARGVNMILCVVEPSVKSVDIAIQIKKFAEDIGVRRVEFVANKIRDPKDVEFIEQMLPQKPFHYIPYDETVVRADAHGVSLIDYDANCAAVKALEQLKEKIVSNVMEFQKPKP